MRLLVLILSFVVASYTLPVEAQFSSDPLSIVVSPQYPRPYETVLITPRSTQFSLSSAQVVITANGVEVERGSGERTVAVKLGAPGSSTRIQVTVTSNGSVYTTETTIRPADVALVVEPLTTSHPLYDGASLVAAQGPVRLVAVSDLRNSAGARISANSLSYTWRLGNKVLTEESGIGRSSFVANAPSPYRDAEVSVTVTSPDQQIVGYGETTVSPTSQSVRAYRTDPLLGIDLAHALSGSLSLRGEEESYTAVPYHFASPPQVSWVLNGSPAGNNATLTVRTDDDASGRASVQYSATLSGGASSGAFTVIFGGDRGSLFAP